METLGAMIFLRAPRKGTVKTRLAATLGADAALSVHRELLDLTLAQLAPFDTVELRITPDDALKEVAPLIHCDWTLSPQGGGDLGDRLARGFESAFAHQPGRWIAIGTDCPEIASNDIRTAWEQLSTAEVVLGPALDGGYWLIGLRSHHPELFQGIPWGGPDVFEATRHRARSAGLRVAALRTLRDVDTEADWVAWRDRSPPPSP